MKTIPEARHQLALAFNRVLARGARGLPLDPKEIRVN